MDWPVVIDNNTLCGDPVKKILTILLALFCMFCLTTGTWVVLLRISSNAGTVEQASVGDVLAFIPDYPFPDSTDERMPLAELDSDVLIPLFEELQYVECKTPEEDAKKWALDDTIGEILDARYDEKVANGEAVESTEVVTKEILEKFVVDVIYECKASPDIPELQELLNKLEPFLDEVEANGTDENIFEYWETYWNEIRGKAAPTWYVKG